MPLPIRALLTLILCAPLLAGCGTGSGSGSDPGASGVHTMSDGTVMKDSEMGHDSGMSGMDMSGQESAPSPTAAMICGDEIAGAVQKNLDLRRQPVGQHSFAHRLFRCTYPLPSSDLRLSVKDLSSPGPGMAYFDALRGRLHDPRPIRGMANFGFPAFWTSHGDVVFIKDHKTLWVDASRVAAADLPAGFSRREVAYGVASAVIACWTE